MSAILRDFRFAVRLLARNPRFSAIAISTLAFGIGANTAMFSILYGVVLKPLPYRHPEQLVRVYSESPASPSGKRFLLSARELLDLRRQAHSLQTLDGWVTTGANLNGAKQPIRVTVSLVTGSLLQSLGVPPTIGRTITQQDETDAAAPQVAVISQRLWIRAFDGDSSIVGRDTLVNGVNTTIIGIMPKGFEFPLDEGDPAEIWVPLRLDPANPDRLDRYSLAVLGRLNPDISLAQAKGEVNRIIVQQEQARDPNTHFARPEHNPVVMFSLQDEVTGTIRHALFTLLVTTSLSLLIACVNVINLLLVRAEARQREFAERSALGASVGRLSRQFMVEGAVLASAGIAMGLPLAYAGTRLIAPASAGLVTRIGESSIDGNALLFTLGTCIWTGLLLGLAPLTYVAFRNLHDPLKASAVHTIASGGSEVTRQIFVLPQVAAAMILLIGFGLMVRSFWNLVHVHPGFDSSGVLTMQVALPRRTYPDTQDVLSFWTRLYDRLSVVPGVKSASLASRLPPIKSIDAIDVIIEGFPPPTDTLAYKVDYYEVVTPNYFDTMGIPLVAGRFPATSGSDESNLTVVINQSMAHNFYGSESPIGHRIRLGAAPDAPWRTIVGVVADVRNHGLREPVGTEVFIPLGKRGVTNFEVRNLFIILRVSGNPTSATPAAEEIIHVLDPLIPASAVLSMDDVVSSDRSRPRFLALLIGLFTCLSLTLATVGLFGTMEYSVARRTREIGIRMALGATSGDILRMFLWNGIILTLVGIGVGMVGAFFLVPPMKGLLFGVNTSDPSILLGASIVLMIVALVACYIPARKATRVNPLVALRYE